MKSIFPSKLAKTAIVSSSILVLVVVAQAAVTYSANFDGMNTDDDGENSRAGGESNVTSINQINPKAGANDLTWKSLGLGYTGHSVGYQSGLSIVDKSPGNQALHISSRSYTYVEGGEPAPSDSQYKGVMINLPSTATLTNIGDLLSVRFTGQFDSAPTLDSGSALRMGFALNDSPNLMSIFTYIGTGTSAATQAQSWSFNNQLATHNSTSIEGGEVPGSTSGTPQNINGTIPFSVIFSIELIDVGTYKVITTINDLSTRTGTITDTVYMVDEVTYTRDFSALDSFFIRSQGDYTDFTLDDVVITYVPEPSAPLVLGSLLCGTLLYRRRV